ncbi:MAG: valine--tRNA ligase [Candidatus Margulisbacteria bacterium]|nr:valine--tRNA ligase [Candidatus Margulisiibacteriota bacterium]
MEKKYSPQDIENKHYTIWEKKGYFKPCGKGKPFSIVMPPPNVTGVLHMGHALDHTLQDVLARYMRLKGRKVLWLPGTDHAGIATQNVVEKHLQSEGKTRADLGREAFIKRVWEWKESCGQTITNQIRRLGDSVDWSRERFTMDDGCQDAVLEAFVSLYESGLIYRGKYIINWCPRCTTALSDVEVEHEDTKSKLWECRYEGSGFEGVVVATTRPETMFGDTAVAVHPDDKRYQSYIGKTVRIPETERWIPIIADTHVDPEFGTGAVKVTPAHDPNDFEIGKRHDLEFKLVMDETAQMNQEVPKAYQGLDRYDCRKKLLTALQESGELVQTKDHDNKVGHCHRCHTVVEPYLSNQWFVSMKTLAKPAIEAVKRGDIKISPKRWEKLYLDWMENIRDWCISRQIWWGHQIPVWYCACEPDTPIVGRSAPTSCPKCKGTSLIQDEDVLDTWFSSALWPFSTLGWPNANSQDLKTFFPTSVLITGYDIMTFWVSRMIVMGLNQMKEVPFEEVYIHGLIRDITGKKMSKSLGNAIDPLKLIDQYGADALRFSLASSATMGGQDIRYSSEKTESARNFANKIWNASRYILMGLETHEGVIENIPEREQLSVADRWILSEFYTALEIVSKAYQDYNFALVSDTIWHFTWDLFCDWYLEMSKLHKEESLPVLIHVLMNILKLLHPLMPFVTEEIWQRFMATGKIGFERSDALILAEWPKENPGWIDTQTNDQIKCITDLIREIRNIRAKYQNSPRKECRIMCVAPQPSDQSAIKIGEDYIKALAHVSCIRIEKELKNKPVNHASFISGSIQGYIDLEGLIDPKDEIKRLTKDLKKIQVALMGLEKKLGNNQFLSQAPKDIVKGVKQKRDDLKGEAAHLLSQIQRLKNSK